MRGSAARDENPGAHGHHEEGRSHKELRCNLIHLALSVALIKNVNMACILHRVGRSDCARAYRLCCDHSGGDEAALPGLKELGWIVFLPSDSVRYQVRLASGDLGGRRAPLSNPLAEHSLQRLGGVVPEVRLIRNNTIVLNEIIELRLSPSCSASMCEKLYVFYMLCMFDASGAGSA